MDAAVEAAAIHGLARLSVGDVATRAGLSRQTLYKYFPSKDELVAEAVVREVGTIVEQVVSAADAYDDPAASLEAAIVTTLRLTGEHQLLDRLIHTEPEALLPLLVGDGGPVTGAVRAIVEQIVERRMPELSPADVHRCADLLGRLLVSYAVSAPDDSPDEVGRFIATLVTGGLASPGTTRQTPTQTPTETPTRQR